jgi:serine/threonine-protein kinase
MGEVYLAEDEQLGRPVALKVLLPEFARDAGRARRFLREARVAAGLSHPGIISVFEIGEHEGVAYIAMEYVRGVTLRSRLTGEPLEIREALTIARQIAEALACAHEAGVIHRDVKPENVMLTGGGHLKVLDFGLARETSTDDAGADLPTLTLLTMAGHAVGTPAYMSPEQLRGLHVDARTDIFALGVVLYEMLAGRRPFDAPSHADSVLRVLSTPPHALARLNYAVPEALERIVRKCLEKDPDWRYQSARELAIDLGSVERDSGSGVLAAARDADVPAPRARAARPRHGLAVWAALGVALALAASIGAYALAKRPRAIDSVAILPFVNASGTAALDYAADGLFDSVQRRLSRVPGVRIPARSRVERYSREGADPIASARELDVGAVLTGRIRRRDDGAALTVELVDPHGTQLWTQTYVRTAPQLANLDDDLVRDLAARLHWTLPARSGARDTRSGNPAAEDAYLKARFHLRRRTPADLQQAVRYFQDAIERDPSFATAYAGLGDSYALIANYGVQPPLTILPQAKAAARRALELDPANAEAHTSLGIAVAYADVDWTAAEQSFRRAIELEPDYAQAHSWFAIAVLTPLKRFEEAIIEARRGVELEPDEPIRPLTLVTVLYMARRYDEALAELARIDATYLAPAQRALQALCLSGKGLTADAVRALGAERPEPDQTVQFNRAVLAYTLARDGRTEDARRIAEPLARESREAYGSACLRATIDVALKRTDSALQLLDACFDARDVEFRFLSVDARYDPIRGDPRFAALLRRAGLP